MIADISQISIDRIADVLGSLRDKGVRLWSDNGQLRYRAPKGALTQQEFDRLKQCKEIIVAHLERAESVRSIEPRPGSRLGRAPLSFSQLVHWNYIQSGERRVMRHIASATRLRGRLEVNVLQRVVNTIHRRHDALRTRIVVGNGTPMQVVMEPHDYELQVEDLSALPADRREDAVRSIIERLILEPIDLAVDSLFAIRLLRLHDEEHVLAIAMEHLISDAFSRSILLRDVLTAYRQEVSGKSYSLPPIAMQFADYAAWQMSMHPAWLKEHGGYWTDRLSGCRRVRFPKLENDGGAARKGWASVPIQISSDMKEGLREWARLMRTTLAMSVFTAYVALVLRWCNVTDVLILYQSNGRTRPEIENTVGYIASTLYLRIELNEGDRLLDLMDRVTGEYCRAYEHSGSSYLEAQLPRPEFTRSAGFNWVSQGPQVDLTDLHGSEHAIIGSPFPYANPVLSHLDADLEPAVHLYDTDDGIVGRVSFPLNRFSAGTMERFSYNLLAFLGQLLSRPDARVGDIRIR